jgi:hypothetical protein
MNKRICLLAFIGSIIFCNVSAQSDFFIKNNNIEKWYIEKENIAFEVKKIMNLPEFYNLTNGKISVEELLPNFHFIDFDNNGIADLIFSGKIYDTFYTFIFYKKNNNYLVSLGEKGSIMQANFPNMDNGLCFSLWDEVCCFEYVNTFTQYACISTNNTSYFHTINKSLIYRNTMLPQARLEKPVAFKTNDVSNVRNTPFVDDESAIGGKHSWKGNTLGIYSPNATGTIYAEIRDNKNEFWYFVRMNNESGIPIHSNRFTVENKEENENCFSYGWINSKDVTFVE